MSSVENKILLMLKNKTTKHYTQFRGIIYAREHFINMKYSIGFSETVNAFMSVYTFVAKTSLTVKVVSCLCQWAACRLLIAKYISLKVMP